MVLPINPDQYQPPRTQALTDGTPSTAMPGVEQQLDGARRIHFPEAWGDDNLAVAPEPTVLGGLKKAVADIRSSLRLE